jgi:hypothetical protein
VRLASPFAAVERLESPIEVFGRIDVREQEFWIAELPQFLLWDVPYTRQGAEQLTHGPRPPIKGSARCGSYLAFVRGAQRVQSSSEVGYDGGYVAGEQAE